MCSLSAGGVCPGDRGGEEEEYLFCRIKKKDGEIPVQVRENKSKRFLGGNHNSRGKSLLNCSHPSYTPTGM